MRPYERLEELLGRAKEGKPWVLGRVPEHYKRLSVDFEKAEELAKLGAVEVGSVYGDKLYFTQALIAGAIFSGEYDKIVAVTPSAYGKSWLLGHVTPVLASYGEDWYVAGATGDKTGIIMDYVIRSLQEADKAIQLLLENVDKSKLDKLATTLSKSSIKFGRSLKGEKGGSIEAVSLGDSYQGLAGNKAIGKPGNYIVDEAALVSVESMIELGRREFKNIDGHKDKLVMISNPHSPGYFYNALIEEDPDERTFIVWADALTAVEEERFSAKQVLSSENAKNSSTCRRYLLCELDVSDDGMFEPPVVDESPDDGTYFLGVDAAYKGKDNISVCLLRSGSRLHVDKIWRVEKRDWIDGVTSQEIIELISRICGRYMVQTLCVDVGYGVWLVEGLARIGLPVVPVNFNESPSRERVRANHYAATNASNKRAEMHLDLQNLLENKAITWSEEAAELVKDEILAVTCKRRANGKIQIAPKPEIKAQIGKSPDELDSVLLAVHAFITNIGMSYEPILE